MSSLAAEPAFHPQEDWYPAKTMHSCSASKFQIELIIAELEHRTLENVSSDVVVPNGDEHEYVAQHLIPGYRYLMLAAFYVVHIVFSFLNYIL